MAGTLVSADGTEGASVTAGNEAHAATMAARAAGLRPPAVPNEAQTLAPLRKHRELQAGACGQVDAGAQATAWDIADAHAGEEALGEEEEDPLLRGSVLPAGGAEATGGPGWRAGGSACLRALRETPREPVRSGAGAAGTDARVPGVLMTHACLCLTRC